MLPVVMEYPKMDFESVLSNIGFVRTTPDEVKSKIPFLREKYFQTRASKQEGAAIRWIMGQIRPVALGNVPLKDLGEIVGQS
jgi:glutamyl-tRNA(Gln) amidotransferase subunit E